MAINAPDNPHEDLDSAVQGWEAVVNANNDKLDQGFHFPRYDTTGDLPTASTHTGLFAPVGSTSSIIWYYSDGTSWLPAGAGMQSDPGDSTATDVPGIVADHNVLLAKLRNLGILV